MPKSKNRAKGDQNLFTIPREVWNSLSFEDRLAARAIIEDRTLRHMECIFRLKEFLRRAARRRKELLFSGVEVLSAASGSRSVHDAHFSSHFNCIHCGLPATLSAISADELETKPDAIIIELQPDDPYVLHLKCKRKFFKDNPQYRTTSAPSLPAPR